MQFVKVDLILSSPERSEKMNHSMYEKVSNNHGSCIYNMTEKEDQENVLHKLGGKEKLETGYPAMYAACCRVEQQTDYNTETSMPVGVCCDCIGEGSEVTTVFGYKQKIEQLQSGDQLIDTTGKVATVDQVIRGQEEKIYNIITESREINLTSDHPIMLASGTKIQASKLQAGDLLSMYDGKTAEVTDVREMFYNGYVYNLMIQENDDGTFLYVNDFVVGDFAAQNRPLRKKMMADSEEYQKIREEAERLYAALKLGQ